MKKQTKAEQIQEELDANRCARGATESRAATQEAAEIMAAQVRRRQSKFRKRKRDSGYIELRGLFTKPENIRAIKLFVDALEIGFILPKKLEGGSK